MCNANEQYSRKYNLRVGGIKEEPGEDCYEAISSFVSNEMGVTMDDAEIDCVHRVGKAGGSLPHQMIIKFKGYRAKQAVLKSCRELIGKKGLYVREDLTAKNLDLFHYARAAEFISSVCSSDGKIFVKLKVNSSIHVVCCKDDVLNLQFV
jgi:hypothetical protein